MRIENLNYIIALFIMGFLLSGTLVHAETISLDKSSYVYGDTIKVSGSISTIKGQFIGLQILSPSKVDIVTIDQFLPKNDGTFSKSYKAQGLKWESSGIYTVKIVYGNQNFEKTFSFKKESAQDSEKPSGKSELEPIQSKLNSIQDSQKLLQSNFLKTFVKGFPDPINSPNYYLIRYYNEPDFKDWFDNTFPGYTIEQVVGYSLTHISGFPDNELSPWSYVKRYNGEEEFREWFDSQFPNSSIYDVLGYPESSFQRVPVWIKNNANWWASGLINDSDFLLAIEYMIKENIIVISELPEISNSESGEIPSWVKNTAKWWADDLIDENDFVKGIQFLVQTGIISI